MNEPYHEATETSLIKRCLYEQFEFLVQNRQHPLFPWMVTAEVGRPEPLLNGLANVTVVYRPRTEKVS